MTKYVREGFQEDIIPRKLNIGINNLKMFDVDI